jgi:hypothetical protein
VRPTRGSDGRRWAARACTASAAGTRSFLDLAWRGVQAAGGMASDADDELRDAVECGDTARINAALFAGGDANAHEGTHNMTPLQVAALLGQVPAIAALLAGGARLDGPDSDGITPLMLAADHAQFAAVETLLAGGADVHHANAYANTALHLACMCDQLEIARSLLAAGARSDVRNHAGMRPIDVVCAPLAHSPACALHASLGSTAVTASRRWPLNLAGAAMRKLPWRHCWHPRRPGPAAGSSPLPATATCGNGRGGEGRRRSHAARRCRVSRAAAAPSIPPLTGDSRGAATTARAV